ncbi:hypothetical protein [Pseudoalteromonas sp. SA25]|uniref:hypothetical protein n=1 Tax=Pseudoalteromonas sp. SA25 TaxID=2686347 RepID=UPI0013FD1AA4|nr:hypothetical protein [Pseudoalteromonas sp. SA25]
MRLLIYILALMSAFFVSAVVIDDENSPYNGYEYITADSQEGTLYIDGTYGTSWPSPKAGFDNYFDYDAFSAGLLEVNVLIERVNVSGRYHSYYIKYETYSNCSGSPCNRNERAFTRQFTTADGTVYSCPDSYPVGPIEISGSHLCLREAQPKDCPAGYHSKAVSAQIGGTECVPKECPPAGSGENLSSSPATGGVPFSGGGMYCNDGCAYSVPSSNITSQGYASGTSQGVSCGDKPYDNKKLADEGNEGGCKTTTDESGVSVMTCDTPADQPEGEGTDVDNGESKTDDTPTPKKPLEDCAVDDTACLLRNLQTSSENNNQDAIDNDNLLHNKLIDAITNNTNVIKNSVENLDTTVYLAQQESARNDTIKIQKLDGIIDAIRGIEITGGGGGGTGSGGTGSGGDDCEGSADDCVPIPDSELQVEQINLDQYADKYDDWLPNAELPQEKCITLTTGNTMCLSFEFWIVLFQAISGLMVITALLHSAKIITGAV